MAKLTLNSIPTTVFAANPNEVADKSLERAKFVSLGRYLMVAAAKGANSDIGVRLNGADNSGMPAMNYRKMNEDFQVEHLMYAAKRYCEMTGESCPEDFADFRRQSMRFMSNDIFMRILQGIYTEIVTPILPAVYGSAVGVFADVIEVGFGETAQITVGSNDIPIFQDSAWGAHRSTPRNRFFDRDYTLNPQPKTAQIFAKWTQIVGNGTDFGRFFANITAGLYAKTMGMWNAAMTAAMSDTTLIPSNFSVNYSTTNWVTLANRVAAVNNTSITNLTAVGGAVALSKVLPTQVTGTTNVNMDAAIATLLGTEYVRTGYLGVNMGVKLQALNDVVVPGTQNTTATTILPSDKIWMLANNGRKPMTIAYNSATPITLEIEASKSGDGELGINMTIALDMISIYSSRVGICTVS